MQGMIVLIAETISLTVWSLRKPLRGQVLSAHARALNLVCDQQGWLISLVPVEAGRLPNAIVYRTPHKSFSFTALGIKAGLPWVMTRNVLNMAGLEVIVEAAPRYSAEGPFTARLGSWSAVLERAHLSAQNERLRHQNGLVPLFRYTQAIVQGDPPPTFALDGPCCSAWLALQHLFGGLTRQNRADVNQGVLGLLGLGVGLTPSGDDVLLGLMCLLRSIPGLADAGRLLAEALAMHSRRRTNLVSSTYLAHAARGEFSERLRRFVDALIGGPWSALGSSLEETLDWGHLSGQETVLGVLLGIEWACALYGTDRVGTPH